MGKFTSISKRIYLPESSRHLQSCRISIVLNISRLLSVIQSEPGVHIDELDIRQTVLNHKNLSETLRLDK